MTIDTLRATIATFHADLTAIRRDIHAHPEMGMEEVRTAALVAAKLREWGIETSEGVGNTGVVGTIRGRLPGQRAIGLRADMDALAIPEATGLDYASTNPGVMHACGHDGHTTMLLGAARYLAEHRDFAGTVQLIFQPAEEGRGGAMAMLNDGLFERFPCDAVYGMHTMPGLAVGQFALRKGPLLAASGRWNVVFKGTGGHGGATPHLATDVTIVTAQYIQAIQTIVSRSVAPLEAAVVSVGSIHGGSNQSSNVMPAEIEITGTMRCFNTKVQQIIDSKMASLAQALATANGCTAEVTLRWGTHTLVNHDTNTDVATAAAAALVGEGKVDANIAPVTGGEDFAFMLEKRPGAFIFIGNGIVETGRTPGLHTPHFNFNDETTPLGVAYWVSLVQQELSLAV
ncbi:MAG: amidohydrolase [Acetobacteraceae bacterium]|nr:amidohydrolase [Acetobacteraceae bacterium]